MRVLILLLALVAVPLLESVAQNRRGSNGRRQSEVRRGDDQKCQAAAQAAAVRRNDHDDDDDDGDRRSAERQARERREREARRAREQARRASNSRHGDDDDDDGDDDDDDGRRSAQPCNPTEPPVPPPADDPAPTPTSSEVRGVVFHDVNGNSLRDADEPGLPNWLVMLRNAQGMVNLRTDAEGKYAFVSLALGEYVLCQEQGGGAQSFPVAGANVCSGAVGYELSFSAHALRNGLDFGNWMP